MVTVSPATAPICLAVSVRKPSKLPPKARQPSGRLGIENAVVELDPPPQRFKLCDKPAEVVGGQARDVATNRQSLLHCCRPNSTGGCSLSLLARAFQPLPLSPLAGRAPSQPLVFYCQSGKLLLALPLLARGSIRSPDTLGNASDTDTRARRHASLGALASCQWITRLSRFELGGAPVAIGLSGPCNSGRKLRIAALREGPRYTGRAVWLVTSKLPPRCNTAGCHPRPYCSRHRSSASS